MPLPRAPLSEQYICFDSADITILEKCCPIALTVPHLATRPYLATIIPQHLIDFGVAACKIGTFIRAEPVGCISGIQPGQVAQMSAHMRRIVTTDPPILLCHDQTSLYPTPPLCITVVAEAAADPPAQTSVKIIISRPQISLFAIVYAPTLITGLDLPQLAPVGTQPDRF